MRFVTTFFLSGLLLICSAHTLAGPPTEQLRESIDQIMKALEGASSGEQARLRVAKILNERFDFNEMSKRALGRHWKGLSSAQQKEFSGLFQKLLERTYLSHISAEAKGRVEYGKEKLSRKGNKAKVAVKLISKHHVIPVVYSVLEKQGSWFIYDVQIEGVGLIKNYRTNFYSIMAKESYAVLVERLREKIATSAPDA